VGAAEGVVDVEVAEAGELFGEGGSLASSSDGSEGFRAGGSGRLRDCWRARCEGADTVGREGDVFVLVDDVVEQEAQAVDDGAKAHGGTACPWGGRGGSRG